jgi:hypothetical protein
MSAVQIQGNASGTGTLTIAAPNTNTNQTLTLPDQTGTFMVNGPAFSAYQSSAQTIATNTTTKVTFDTEEFDTNSNFASSRFTPTVAGYYQINTFVSWGTPTWGDGYLFKNGSSFKQIFYSYSASVSGVNGSTLIYLNGSSDYVEIYLRFGVGQVLAASSTSTWFQGVLVRGA